MTIAGMALERYISISRPFSVRRGSGRALISTLLIWVYSALFASMPLLNTLSRYVPEGYLTSCSFDYLSAQFSSRLFIFVYFCGAFCVPLAITVCSYAGIIHAVRSSELAFKHSHSGKTVSRKSELETKAKSKAKIRQSVEVKLAKLSAVLIGIWLLAWTPYAVVALIGIFGDQSLLTPTVTMFPAMFAKVAAILNPLIYGHSHPRFRAEMDKLFRCGKKPLSMIMNGAQSANKSKRSNELQRNYSVDISSRDVDMSCSAAYEMKEF